MSKFVKAKAGTGNSVIYTDSQGKHWQFKGGSRAWRNNNPGNLVSGNVSKRNGAIGEAGHFAVFADYESGHQGLIDSLKEVHGNKDIPTLMKSYAPPSENNTKKYIAFLRKKTGIQNSKKIADFTKDEFEKLLNGIEKMEGWGKTGKISECVEKLEIVKIRKNKKGVIEAYQIDKIGWVFKDQAIQLALDGKINAIVVNTPTGQKFLRARPNSSIPDNLEFKK